MCSAFERNEKSKKDDNDYKEYKEYKDELYETVRIGKILLTRSLQAKIEDKKKG